MPQPRKPKHKWTFVARFRRHAFGWKSQPAIGRISEAVSEIKKVRRKDPLLAAEGAVRFLEKVSPAIEQVDSSSGSIGTAVNRAISALVPIIAEAPADDRLRRKWLDRLWTALEADEIPYLEGLARFWGELCATPPLAGEQADHLLAPVRMVLSADDRRISGFFNGIVACLSALLFAGRHAEVLELLEAEEYWGLKRYAVRALIASGRKSEAIRYAEACRGPYASDREIDQLCEEILLSSGFEEEAYARYGLGANRAGTYLAWFRAVCKRYPDREPRQVLADLVAHTAGEKGKWFAAAKSAGLLDEAIELVRYSPCDPRTLTRAARDFKTTHPTFAIEAGLAALRWIADGYGYEITGLDVLQPYGFIREAAAAADNWKATRARIQAIADGKLMAASFVGRVLGSELRNDP